MKPESVHREITAGLVTRKHQSLIGVYGGHSSCSIVRRRREWLIMKKIEVVVRRTELRQFFLCAERLGIFGFDLSENRNSSKAVLDREDVERLSVTVDFAVSDADTMNTIHAVLERAHPDSIAIFQLVTESPSVTGAGSGAYSNPAG
jgi:hypothetical protein